MNGIRVNPKKMTVRAEAGCLLQDVDRETSLHGLVMPAGTELNCFTYTTQQDRLFISLGVVGHTGLSGLILGGGIGWLCRFDESLLCVSQFLIYALHTYHFALYIYQELWAFM